MKHLIRAVSLCPRSLISCAQTPDRQKLNLGFEQHEKGYPRNWNDWGSDGYRIYIYSTQSRNGRYSAVIENTSDSIDFRALSIVLPNNYMGKSIRLSGYIKTEDVRDGFAGLLCGSTPTLLSII
ncbi:hypothetical protein [Sphingobacterium yanglingense]|uniref:hypothetical protein n=1 Tax=Sphingobacterium yanglingense TaxID=1437280 RepID=UPI00105B5990|nr:hypothetical protein [Sphingobacterium yanglingense]